MGIVALTALAAALTFLTLTWRQDHEERTRPQRRLVSIEETTAKDRHAWSVVGLSFTIVAILTVVILAMLGG